MPVAHVADLRYAALQAGSDRTGPSVVEHRENDVGAAVELRRCGSIRDLGVVLRSAEARKKARLRIRVAQPMRESGPAPQPRRDANAGEVPHDGRSGEKPRGRSGEKGRLILRDAV